jgi:HD-like signal output (HDOD) protein
MEHVGRRVLELIQKESLPIPPYPAVAARLRSLLATPGYKVSDLAALIASDQSISGQVLQVANSGLFAGLAHASSLRSAILRIGDEEVTRIAIGASLGGASKGPGPLVDLRRRLWRKSLIAAHLAYSLAKLYALPPDDMFMVALLHDFGGIMAVAALEAAVASAPADFAAEIEAWEAVADRHHVELGMIVARRWSLPAMFCDVIAMHHNAEADGKHAVVVRYIQSIDALVSVIDTAMTLTPEAFAHLQLPAQLVNEAIGLMPKVLQQIASFEPAPSRPVRSAIARPGLRLGKPECDVDLTGEVAHAGSKASLQIVKAGPFGMLARSSTRFATTQVVQMQLQVAPGKSLAMCITAQLASEEGGTYLYELTPFAQNHAVNREYVTWLKSLPGAR